MRARPNVENLRFGFRGDDSRAALPPCSPRSEKRARNTAHPTGCHFDKLVPPPESMSPEPMCSSLKMPPELLFLRRVNRV